MAIQLYTHIHTRSRSDSEHLINVKQIVFLFHFRNRIIGRSKTIAVMEGIKSKRLIVSLSLLRFPLNEFNHSHTYLRIHQVKSKPIQLNAMQAPSIAFAIYHRIPNTISTHFNVKSIMQEQSKATREEAIKIKRLRRENRLNRTSI